ncbi:MAG: low molecular weight protein-tyrosine-phosphatase [Burkholderiales bacterium]
MIPALLRNLWPFGGAGREDRIVCRVLFVCLGNVCRSPTAEAVFRQRLHSAGLSDRVACASAGTHGFNRGASADGRARAAAQRRGYDMSRMRGRSIADEDFARFDLVLAMDRQNLEALRSRCPGDKSERLRLLMEFARMHDALDVPDPYYGNAKAFELVLDMIEDACESLVDHVRDRYLTTASATAPGESRPPGL